MAKKAIPADVQQRAVEVVERFNREVLGGDRICYVPRFKGAFLYLDRQGAGALGPICRLKYTGSFEKWEFAIFKYSSMTYDSHAWMFPGSQFIDTKPMPQREAARGAKRWRRRDADCPNES